MTKIDIISGFLGAGKTTFIKQLLKEAISGEKVVLIENEFGQIGIDGGFLKDAGIEIREMNRLYLLLSGRRFWTFPRGSSDQISAGSCYHRAVRRRQAV